MFALLGVCIRVYTGTAKTPWVEPVLYEEHESQNQHSASNQKADSKVVYRTPCTGRRSPLASGTAPFPSSGSWASGSGGCHLPSPNLPNVSTCVTLSGYLVNRNMLRVNWGSFSRDNSANPPFPGWLQIRICWPPWSKLLIELCRPQSFQANLVCLFPAIPR